MIVGLLFSGCGLFGSFATAIIIGKTRKYRAGLFTVCIASMLCNIY